MRNVVCCATVTASTNPPRHVQMSHVVVFFGSTRPIMGLRGLGAVIIINSHNHLHSHHHHIDGPHMP